MANHCDVTENLAVKSASIAGPKLFHESDPTTAMHLFRTGERNVDLEAFGFGTPVFVDCSVGNRVSPTNESVAHTPSAEGVDDGRAAKNAAAVNRVDDVPVNQASPDAGKDSSAAGSVQEKSRDFAGGFQPMGDLYDQATHDHKRSAGFRHRMHAVKDFDEDTFQNLADLGDRMRHDASLTPSQVGSELGAILLDTTTRKPLNGEQMEAMQGAVAGMMMAESATFEGGLASPKSVEMVKAAEEVLQSGGSGLHAVRFPDGEFGIAAYKQGQYDNLNYNGEEIGAVNAVPADSSRQGDGAAPDLGLSKVLEALAPLPSVNDLPNQVDNSIKPPVPGENAVWDPYEALTLRITPQDRSSSTGADVPPGTVPPVSESLNGGSLDALALNGADLPHMDHLSPDDYRNYGLGDPKRDTSSALHTLGQLHELMATSPTWAKLNGDQGFAAMTVVDALTRGDPVELEAAQGLVANAGSGPEIFNAANELLKPYGISVDRGPNRDLLVKDAWSDATLDVPESNTGDPQQDIWNLDAFVAQDPQQSWMYAMSERIQHNNQ